MKRPHRLSPLFPTLIALLLMVGLVVLPAMRELRQQKKNRALITAIKEYDALTVTQLLEEGADADTRDVPGDMRPFWRVLWDRLRGRPKPDKDWAPTALLVALGWYSRSRPDAGPHPDTRIVRTLLEHKADPNVVDEAGGYPLLSALQYQQTEADLLLIRHGAKLDLVQNGERRPLFVDAANDHADPRVLQAMLDQGADINAQFYGETALIAAADLEDVSTVRFLLAHHATVGIADRKGRTALYYALLYAQQNPSPKARQIVRMLRQAGAR